MELITLNTWGGRAGLPLLKKFFKEYRGADIFCLQEIWQTHNLQEMEGWDSRIIRNLLQNIATWLPDYQYYFRPQFRGIYGLATFVHKNIKVENEGELFVFKDQGYENPESIGNHARNIQYLKIKTAKGPMTIINFHGLWNGNGKGDSEDRKLQSQKVTKFIKELKEPHILAGDFNLAPDTESFKTLLQTSPRNLVNEYGVTSTRSSFYTKSVKFADYILASSDVNVQDFSVLPEEVSDHLALRVVFN